MNPWPSDGQHAFYQRQTDAWWAERICYGRQFVCKRVVSVEQELGQEAAQVAALQKQVAALQAQVAQLQAALELDAPMRTLVDALKELLAA
jgi:hypothetical protein